MPIRVGNATIDIGGERWSARTEGTIKTFVVKVDHERAGRKEIPRDCTLTDKAEETPNIVRRGALSLRFSS
jgi:hypothetical protein